MRITLILLLLAVFQVSAINSYSQKTRISINFSDTRLSDVLNEIENQSKFYFLYNQDLIDVDRKISLSAKNQEVVEILDQLFSHTSVKYSIQDRQIILTNLNEGRMFSQKMDISGSVRNKKGEPLPGVTVVIKNTTYGTITDNEGKFILRNVPADAIIQFSFVGMTMQELPVAGQSAFQVILEEETIGIDEVVAIGYGSIKKRDLTGSVISVGAEKLEERPFTNAMQSLAGNVSGVQILQTQGAPGLAPTVKVRGASSINAGTTPLYVIDGMPLEDNTSNSTDTGASSASNMDFNRNPLNFINPNDIESIEILKDASSAAIYGSRGANGVVIITTKLGKIGKTKIDANYEFGISHVNRRVEMMNAKEWIEFQTAARNNTWATNLANDPSAVRDNSIVVPEEFSDAEWLERIGNGTDWQDVLFQTALSHNLQVSASGGNEKTQFMVSGGYLNSEGVVDQNTYDRISFRSNLEHTISDKFSIGAKIGISRASEDPYGTAGKSDVVSLNLQNDPIFPLYVETGSLGFKDPESIWNTFVKYGFQFWHPYSLTREMHKKKVTNVITATSFAEWNISKNLKFKTSFSANIEDSYYNQYWNEGQNWGYSGWVNATATYKTFQSYNWIWENIINFSETFNDVHKLNVLAGYTVQEQRNDYSTMTASSFPNDLVHTLNAGIVDEGSTTAEDWALISYLARANYSYKGKYLLTAAIRADGSSRFGTNNRWGYFPSGSIAWRMSEEAFLADVSWLDNLKLRLSYGVTGNNQISNYGAIGLLDYKSYVNGNDVEQGIYTESFADNNLKWEKTGQVNFGVDLSIFNQRINLTTDVYYSKTHDLLLNVPIPILTGFSSTLTNVGELQNKGIEFNINTHNLTGKFSWTTDFNISANRNKVLKLGENNAPIDISVSSMTSRTAVGKPIGMYYGYIFDGVIMSQAELESGEYPVWEGSEPGDPKVKDVTKDGNVDSDDRTYIGNYQPDFSWGMTNNFSFKGWELSIMLRGSHGGEIMNHSARYLKSNSGGGNRNQYKVVTNYWKSESDPGNGKIFKPRAVANTVQGQGSNYWVEDGSFVRIQNIRLGYSLPSGLVNKLKLNRMKLYLNLENVYVFSDYNGYDPESSTYQTGVLVGFDYGAYPTPFVATVGVNVTF